MSNSNSFSAKIRILLIIYLLMGFPTIFAQSKFSFGISTGYLMNNRIITHAESKNYKNYRNSNESYRIGFELEALIYYSLTDHLKLESGLGYLQNGYKVDEKRLIDPGFSPLTSGYYSELYQFSLKNIYVPVRLNYGTSGKINFNASIGISLVTPVSKEFTWILRTKFGESSGQSEKSISKMTYIPDLNLSADMGLGIGYRLFGKCNIILLPKVSYFLIGYENSDARNVLYNISMFNGENKSTTEHLIQFGLSLKIIYGL
jgi:hypothetical protein